MLMVKKEQNLIDTLGNSNHESKAKYSTDIVWSLWIAFDYYSHFINQLDVIQM
jgi:hypothetical protein